MRRTTGLKRRTSIKRKRDEPRRSGRRLDPEYMGWVRTQPCFFFGDRSAGPCWGRVDPHHAGPHPVGRKADDDTCVPLCRGHHDDLHDGRRFFLGKPAAEIREWSDGAIARTRARHASSLSALDRFHF